MDFKFVAHRLWSEKQNVLKHMHKKEFWILTNKCGNNGYSDYFHIHWSNFKILFHAYVVEGCSASLTIAREKQT